MSELKPEKAVRWAKEMCMFLPKRQECRRGQGQEIRNETNGNCKTERGDLEWLKDEHVIREWHGK